MYNKEFLTNAPKETLKKDLSKGTLKKGTIKEDPLKKGLDVQQRVSDKCTQRDLKKGPFKRDP